MIWVLELIVLLIFVGFGGFEGFIAWAVLTALVLFARHSQNQTKLKAAELILQAEKNKHSEAPVLLPVQADASEPSDRWASVERIDFRTMMWSASHMVRRVSATQWEMKYDAVFRRKHAAELTARLARPPVVGPSVEDCSECGLDVLSHYHRPSCSKYDEREEQAVEAAEEDAFARDRAADELKRLEQEPTWEPFPEALVAAIETRYQRYLARG
jgi:hypothetical protein